MYYVVIATNEYGDRCIQLNVLSEEQLRRSIFNFMSFYFCAKERVKEGKETINWLENLPNKLEIYDVWDKHTATLPLNVKPDFELNYKTLQNLINLYKSEKNVNCVHVGSFLDFFMEWRK